jgi:two-component system, OmpR family, sensor histidine kinase KdpD
MAKLIMNTTSKLRQSVYSMLVVGIASVFCYGISAYVGYHVIAFILLLVVSLVSMFFDIVPVLLTAFVSALVWDFFFIPPHFTITVGTTEDRIFLMMYFVVALISATLTYKIRKIEKSVWLKEEKINTIRLYNTLLNSLSHELRTPIATIIGATDNLQHNAARLTDSTRKELVGEIAKASLKLNQHVENLLNMSRLESGFIQPKNDWCDINELVYDIVKRVEENKINQTISVNVDGDLPLANVDKGILEQVLFNLVSNASIYTPAGSAIIVSAKCEGDVLEVAVEDNGKGFPVNEIERVFDKFYRLKDAKTGGTGLGLSIVKGFTEAMGGRVALENVAAGGARFTIKIPAEMSYLKNVKHE